ncbi:sensor histidine kinase [Luteimonas deserti]|nr:PAS domain S-box protein [Luteimonas deserti]
MRLSRYIRTRLPDLLAAWATHVEAAGPGGALHDRGRGLLLGIADALEAASPMQGEAQTTALPGDGLQSGAAAALAEVAMAIGALRTTVLRAWLSSLAPFDASHVEDVVHFNQRIDHALAAAVLARETQAAHVRTTAEAALRESEARYRGIVDTALDYAIFTTDADGLIDSWPPGARAVFGWSSEEALGQHAAITFTREDRAADVPAQEMRGARENGVAADVRWHVCKDGECVFIEGAMRPVIDASGTVTGYLKVGRDATERKHWDERQQVLMRELQHRTRNIMAVVLTMFEKTRRGSADVDTLSKTFRARLGALARVQGLLSRLQEGDRIAFDTLVRAELSAMGALDEGGRGDRVELSGPSGVFLRSGTVQTFALALHELATNAAKYGALAQDEGRLSVRWRATRRDGRPSLHIEWIETCVDMALAASAAQGSGYGRELIEQALPYQLDALTTYVVGPEGVRCTIEVPISDTTSAHVIALD